MQTARLGFVLIVGALSAVACKDSKTTGTGRTERERDSIIGQSKVPGAGAVRKALDVADSSRTRIPSEDSAAAP